MKRNRIFLFLLMSMSVFLLLPYVLPKFLSYYYEKSFEPITYKNADEFENKLLKGTEQLIEKEIAVDENFMYYHTLGDFLYHITTRSSREVFEYGEYGYLLYFSYLYAQNRSYDDIRTHIEERFFDYIVSNQTIKRNDQISYGCLSSLLYSDKNNRNRDLYGKFCTLLIERIDSIRQSDGLVRYRDGDDNQQVDGIGLVAPFLFLYSDVFNDAKGNEIGHHLVSEYLKYGVDCKTGIPSQAYNVKTKIKNLRSNWGRGISWWLLGLMQDKNLSEDELQTVSKGDSTLVSLFPEYHQYLGDSCRSMQDMSAIVPITFYLYQKGLIHITRTTFINIIAPYTDDKGIIRYNSPTIGKPLEKPNAFQSHFLTQGIALYMLSVLPD